MRLLDCVDQDIDYIGGKLTTYKNLHSQAMNGVWPGLLPPCRSGSQNVKNKLEKLEKIFISLLSSR